MVGVLNIAAEQNRALQHIGDIFIVVRKKYWNKGLGRILLEEGIAWAESSGVIRKLDLSVHDVIGPIVDADIADKGNAVPELGCAVPTSVKHGAFSYAQSLSHDFNNGVRTFNIQSAHRKNMQEEQSCLTTSVKPVPSFLIQPMRRSVRRKA